MRVRCARSILRLTAAAVFAAPADASAQSVDVGLDTAGLVSFQPIDSSYVAMRGRRARLLVTGRVYPRLQRSASAQQLGIGRDVFRGGVGVRWRLGSS